jgi:dipeptidyl aminopeptidase/acylaminoacyl peptidase
MDKAGKPYEWMVKPEGHGFYNVENRVEMYTKVLEFLNKHTQ